MGLDAPALEDAAVIETLSMSGIRQGARAILAVAALCGGCTPKRTEEGETAPPQVTLYGVRLSYFKGSQISAEGRATKVTYQRSSSDFTASDALLRFPSRAGVARVPGGAQTGLEVRAPIVNGNMSNKQADGIDGVILRTGSGMVGRTRSAHFDGKKQEVTGNEPVTLDGPQFAVASKKFFLNLKTEEFLFEEEV
jgi:hypothetical protein